MIEAVVFDFDGLILDTETNEFASFQELFKEHGAELTLEVWGSVVGTNGFDTYAHLDECVGRPVDRETARARRKERFQSLMETEDIRPGVREYLESARRLGLRIGLASSSRLDWVTGYLDRYGLTSYFECIQTADHVEKVKPDPALYRQVLEQLGVAPERALAFEDSPNGALAAKRAGMKVVTVPNPLTCRLVFGEVDRTLGSMSEISLEDLIAELGAKTEPA
ncbi:HAD family hydrolase [Paenibacillus sp. CC-CFT747]|nr:HAD family hydrolase [Paenibacillus sp. CC-CFT747]